MSRKTCDRTELIWRREYCVLNGRPRRDTYTLICLQHERTNERTFKSRMKQSFPKPPFSRRSTPSRAAQLVRRTLVSVERRRRLFTASKSDEAWSEAASSVWIFAVVNGVWSLGNTHTHRERRPVGQRQLPVLEARRPGPASSSLSALQYMRRRVVCFVCCRRRHGHSRQRPVTAGPNQATTKSNYDLFVRGRRCSPILIR